MGIFAQETAGVPPLRQFRDFLQKHLDTDYERFYCFLKAIGLSTDVKISAKRLPTTVTGIGITSEFIFHFILPQACTMKNRNS